MRDKFQEAKSIDIVWFLTEHGYSPVRESSRSASYLSPLREETNASFHVDKIRNRWSDRGVEGWFGDLTDLVSRIESCTTSEAADKILGREGIKQYHKEDVEARQKPNIDILQVKENIECEALIRYLEDIRKIPLEVGNQFCGEVTFQFPSSRYATHLGISFPNDLGGVNIRNSWFQGTNKPSGISTVNYTESMDLMLFEAFLDMISWVVINGDLPCTAIVLNSLVYIPFIIDALRGYDEVKLYLDNDAAADLKIEYLVAEEISIIDCRDEFDGYKDINCYLQANFDF